MSVNTDPPDPKCHICGKPVDIMHGLLAHHSCVYKQENAFSNPLDLIRRLEALEKRQREEDRLIAEMCALDAAKMANAGEAPEP